MIYHNEDEMTMMTSTDTVSPSSSRTNSCEEDALCSSPELDVVSCTPGPQSQCSSSADDPNNQKRYFCQRCLNHKLEFPRKGHKPFCRFAMCHCDDCMMVEYRRRLNNQLSQRRLDPESSTAAKRFELGSGPVGPIAKKVRDPKCARCSAHGEKQALRGHKKALCPYLKCGCHLCKLVENRRTLMAKQIKLRRDQQKARKAQMQNTITSDGNNNKNGGNSKMKTTAFTPYTGNIVINQRKDSVLKLVESNPIVFTRNVERKRSYDSITTASPQSSAIDVQRAAFSAPTSVSTMNNITEYTNNTSPILPSAISPMLLPPSVLYQQLCLQTQQQQNVSSLMDSSDAINSAQRSNQLKTSLVTPSITNNSTLSLSDFKVGNNANTNNIFGQMALNLLQDKIQPPKHSVISTPIVQSQSRSFSGVASQLVNAFGAFPSHQSQTPQAQDRAAVSISNLYRSANNDLFNVLTNVTESSLPVKKTSMFANSTSDINSPLMSNALQLLNIHDSLNGSKFEPSLDFVQRLLVIMSNDCDQAMNSSSISTAIPANNFDSSSFPAVFAPTTPIDSNLSFAQLVLQYSAALASNNGNIANVIGENVSADSNDFVRQQQQRTLLLN